MRRGFSLIDLILAIGIIITLFGGIFLVYFSIIDTAVNYELRRAASSLLAQRVELVRTLPYEQVGVSGGIPAGVLPQSEQVSWDGRLFIVEAYVRNVDDPFDGTVTSQPTDTAPADYKLVEFVVSCPTCTRFTPVSITTTAAPQGLEIASQNGSLFISVFDANGQPVAGAEVTIVNSSVSPAINFSEVTDDNGSLQLVDVPTSTQAYQVAVSKPGYSSEATYATGGAGNPNPMKPHATVGTQSVTELSFAIDRLAPVPVSSSNMRCVASLAAPFSYTGSKLIGTTPDVIKTFGTSTTGTSGVTTLNLEWDTYVIAYTGSLDLAGTVPYQPVAIAPSSTQPFRFILEPASSHSLLVTTLDAGTRQPVMSRVTLSGPSSAIASTSYATYAITEWDNDSYANLANIAVGSDLTLVATAGQYSTSSVGIFESQTIDLGGIPASAVRLDWVASNNGLGGEPVRFQFAVSDTDGNYTFEGPDETANSYFTFGTDLPAAFLGKRYFRYRVYLTTDNEAITPSVSSVSVDFTGPCVPPGQRLFQDLGAGSYTVSVSAPGYTPVNTSTAVSAGWQETTITLTPS